jgi:hypothetical protein
MLKRDSSDELLSIIWCRVNGFCLREIQLTTFATLSKQSVEPWMATLVTGQQGTPVLYPVNRAFFLFFIFEENYFFLLKKTQNEKVGISKNNAHLNFGFLVGSTTGSSMISSMSHGNR